MFSLMRKIHHFRHINLNWLIYLQLIEKDTTELEKLRLEKSAKKSQIDEKVNRE